MLIAVVGLSHKTAPVEVREKLAFPEKEQVSALKALLSLEGITEGIILSTCNRVEIYAVGGESENFSDQLVKFMAEYHDYPLENLQEHIYRYEGADAVRHIMQVSASLDSMVLGEPQILGQVKEAYDRALDAGCTRRILNELMKKTFSTAKVVRTNTGISRSAVSISFAAVELARKIFNELSGKTVMVIGAGEMSELAVKHLISQGSTDVLVANRTFENAVALAKTFNGSAIKFDDLSDYLVMSDIVISSTGAPSFILTMDMLKQVIHNRKNKPMFLIDIAVPRDIDPRINDLDNVYLYDIDDLEAVVESNIKERQKEAEKAEEIIAKEIRAFGGWIESLQVVPTIVGLRVKLEEIREAEFNKAQARLKHLSEKDLDVVKALSSGIVNKILHKPITVLKKESKGGNATAYIEAVRRLFGVTRGKAEDKEVHDKS